MSLPFKISLLLCVGFFALIMLPRLPYAQSNQGQISVKDAVLRAPLVKGRPAAIYLTLVNNQSVDDQLLRASAPSVREIQLHLSSRNKDGLLTMLEQPYIDIPANSEVKLEPGALHFMMMGWKYDPQENDSEKVLDRVDDKITVTLFFSVSPPIQVDVPIRTLNIFNKQ